MPFKNESDRIANSKEYYNTNKEAIKDRVRKRSKSIYDKAKLDHYVVYYLPEEHYCGVTSHLRGRLVKHEKDGNSTEGWRVLYASEDEMEAVVKEAEFQIVLGMNGHREISRINNKNKNK